MDSNNSQMDSNNFKELQNFWRSLAAQPVPNALLAPPGTFGRMIDRSYFRNKLDMDVQALGTVNANRQIFEQAAKNVLDPIRDKLKEIEPNSEIHLVGSLASGMDTEDSDLDFIFSSSKWEKERIADKWPGEKINDKKLAGHCLFNLKNVLQNAELIGYWGRPFLTGWVYFFKIPLFKLKEKASGMHVDIVSRGDDTLRNTLYIKWYGELNSDFRVLYRTFKRWGTSKDVKKNGKMNSFSLGLLLIHYLQEGAVPAVTPPLLATYPELENMFNYPEAVHLEVTNEELLRSRWRTENTDSVGVLFYKMIEYIDAFDFENFYIAADGRAVRRGDEHFKSNRGDNERHLMVILDPKKPEWNCTATVQNEENYLHIKSQIRDLLNTMNSRQTLFQFKESAHFIKNINDGIAVDMRLWDEYDEVAKAAEKPSSSATTCQRAFDLKPLPKGNKPDLFWDMYNYHADIPAHVKKQKFENFFPVLECDYEFLVESKPVQNTQRQFIRHVLPLGHKGYGYNSCVKRERSPSPPPAIDDDAEW